MVIEGGGMKAAYANGVLSAFEEAGLRAWDLVIGTSAGGALAAWYAAGQAVFAQGTWDYSRDPAVLSYGRWLRRRGPVLDHEYLLDSVYVQHHPLDQRRLRAAPFPVVVTASRTLDGGTTYHDLRDGPIIPWLKATGRLPLGAGPPVRIDDIEYLDGGITDPVPVRHAVEVRGMTDITLITNAAAGVVGKDNPFVARLLARKYPALADGIVHHQQRKEAAVAYALAPPPGITARVVRPSRPTRLGRLTRDKAMLDAAIALGRADAAVYLRDAPGA